MSQIVKAAQYSEIEINSANLLPTPKKLLVLALMDSKIAIIEKQVAGNSIYEVLKVAEIDSGLSKMNNLDLIALAKSVYDLICEKYPNFTVSEFKSACKNGVIGNYGQWFGMCLKSVNEWIKGYLNSPERALAILEWNKLISEKTFRISEEPIILTKDYLINSAKQSFENYKETGKLPYVPHAIYDTIKEISGLSTLIDKKDWPEIQEIAKKEYSERQTPKRGLKRGINESLDFSVSNRSYEFELKKQMLIFYFNGLISKGKNLEL